MKKKTLLMFFTVSLCAFLCGCDRKAPELSVESEVIEQDCGSSLNLEDYLNENLKITDETDDGIVDYKLADLTHTIKVDKEIYNSETGEIDTNTPGEYTIDVSVSDESKNQSSLSIKLKLDPLKLENTVEETVSMDCGEKFDILDYFNSNVRITNQSEDVQYKIEDFDYSIECDDSIYDGKSSELDTTKFGEFPIKLKLNSKSFDNDSVSFTLKLNPMVVDKGYYVYKDEYSEDIEFLGFCEYKNASSENLTVKSIEFRYYDKDGVLISSSDMPDYSLSYVASGSSGYALDTYASFNAKITSEDEIDHMDVEVDYDKPIEEDTTSLEVGEMEIVNNYEYNVSGFGGSTIITNPYDKGVEYYSLLAGMYDDSGKLIGVMESMDCDSIKAGEKARATVSWLPDSRKIPDMVKSIKGSARVTSFVE